MLYRIGKVLAADELAVHLRSYANRFKEPPTRVASSELSMGALGSPEGFGIGHFPLARTAFNASDYTFLCQESVADDELEGYHIWASMN